MIGDNPKSDIEGGNRMGWTTILVKTGVYSGKSEESSNNATYIV